MVLISDITTGYWLGNYVFTGDSTSFYPLVLMEIARAILYFGEREYLAATEKEYIKRVIKNKERQAEELGRI